ncbi:MAG: DMT family transporter [Hyphomicrobiales bacterium]|nr:DMT family transporter [Hyphomicrobiales bacterium]
MELIRQKNLQGIILMVISMGLFAVADSLIKLMSVFISPAQVLFFMIGGGMVVFTIIVVLQKERLFDRRAFAPVLLVRYLSEVIGMAGMVLALTYVPLSIVGAILQATPLLVVVGAVLFLGEKVSWRRWSSIGVGFFGVLLIIQPGAEGFDAKILFAVMSMVGLSVRDLTTRWTPPDMASASLATYTMAATFPFAIGWLIYNGENMIPAQANWVMILAMIALGSVGYMLLIKSIRMAEVSIVSPFRYSRLIFLLFIGVVIFDERPGISTLFGALLIIVSGIYIMWRERRVREATR